MHPRHGLLVIPVFLVQSSSCPRRPHEPLLHVQQSHRKRSRQRLRVHQLRHERGHVSSQTLILTVTLLSGPRVWFVKPTRLNPPPRYYHTRLSASKEVPPGPEVHYMGKQDNSTGGNSAVTVTYCRTASALSSSCLSFAPRSTPHLRHCDPPAQVQCGSDNVSASTRSLNGRAFA